MPETLDAPDALDALAERYWQFLRHEFPLTACLAGQPSDDPTMFREAPADFERRARRAGELLRELDAIPAAALSMPRRATHRLLRRELEDLRQVHATLSHLRPWLLPAGPEFNTFYFCNTCEVGDAAAAATYVDRIASFATFFRDVRECLREGAARGLRTPKAVLQPALANLRRAAATAPEATPWFGPFKRSAAAAQAGVQAQAGRALSLIAGTIAPPLAALAEYMERELLPRARDSIACTANPLGEEFYRFWLRHFTTLPEATPASVHALGLAQVERIGAEIAAVAAEAGFAGDVPGYRRFLRDEKSFYAPTAEALRQQVEALAKRIDGKIPTLAGRLPRITYGVQSIPEAAAEHMPLAYAQPNPADGASGGWLWVNSLPARVPSYVHLPLVLHEAWPGHLMHIALMQETDTLPMFRRANFTKYTACLEGWAMYCETLGIDLGLYTTPHQHYGRLDMEMWRACRLVVDTGIHAQGWSRERAVAYMAEHLTMSRSAIEAEVDRYIAMPGQALAYLVGGLKFRELRQRARERLGDRFNLRAYHDQVLAAGPVTLPVLEETVDDWLAHDAA